MKVTLPPASKLRRNKKVHAEAKFKNLENIVVKFINEKVKKAILHTDNNCVNVEIPIDTYSFGDDFYKMAETILLPLGYTSTASHDGGGMYATLFVTWK